MQTSGGHRGTRAARRRGWIVGVIVVALVVGGVVAVKVVHHGPRDGFSFTATPPLLPGAPVLIHPVEASALTVDPQGYDVSYPQCGRVLPATGGYAIVGVTGGSPFTSNPCRGVQLSWATTKPAHAVYVNTAYRGKGDPVAYGQSIAHDAVARERASGSAGTPMWWLDVETVNRWDGTQQQNATVLDAAAATLQGLGARVGIYSTPNMWSEITGDWEPGLPTWYATGHGTRARSLRACSDTFAGVHPSIVQWIQSTSQGSLDHDYLCPAARGHSRDTLAAT